MWPSENRINTIETPDRVDRSPKPWRQNRDEATKLLNLPRRHGLTRPVLSEIRQRALSVIGRFDVPDRDISRRHDAYLAEALRRPALFGYDPDQLGEASPIAQVLA